MLKFLSRDFPWPCLNPPPHPPYPPTPRQHRISLLFTSGFLKEYISLVIALGLWGHGDQGDGRFSKEKGGYIGFHGGSLVGKLSGPSLGKISR
jgi:hypothetical protein